MALKVLISAATERELSSLRGSTIPGIEADFLLTGVGPVATTFNLMDHFTRNPIPDIVINSGIAGSFSPDYPVGRVVVVGSDSFGDLGIEKEGRFFSLFDAGFENPDDSPYKNGMVHPSQELLNIAGTGWPVVKAITVNTSSGNSDTIGRLIARFKPDIETMEGAAFYYACSRLGLNAIAIRSISNMVLPGDRSGWNIDLALKALGPALKKLMEKFVSA